MLCSSGPQVCRFYGTISRLSRTFSIISFNAEKALPPRLKINEGDITESFLKGSGPGGQKINKTSSAVQLKHLPTGIVVKSQETRSRDQNRKLARQILAEKLDQIANGSDSRVAIKAERARKKKASASKKSRRKYRKLEGEEHSMIDADQDTSTQQDDTSFESVAGERSPDEREPALKKEQKTT